MRKDIIKKGIIILVIGIVLAVAGISITADYLKVGTNYIQKNGIYESHEINISGNGLIDVEGGNSTFYLVKASNINSINKSNIANYSLIPVNGNMPETGSEFLVPGGSYYLVSFLSPAPGVIYSYVSHETTFTALGILLLIGLLLMGISVIVLILGFVKREKFKPPEEEFFKEENKN